MNTTPLKSKAYYFMAVLLATIAVYPLLFIYLSIVFINDHTLEMIITNGIFLVSILLLMIAIPSFVTFFSTRRNSQEKVEYYAVAILCYVIGYIMLFYGTDKLINKQFVVFYKGLDTRLNDIDSYTLTWYYYGRSNTQVFIMGFLETLPALLLLFRRTRFIGSIIMLPVIANVLVTNIFNRISPFTLFAITLLTIFNLFIIYSYKNEIKELVKKINTIRTHGAKNSRWRIPIIACKILFWGFIVVILGMKTKSYLRNEDNFLYGNGAYQLTGLKINDKQINLDSVPARWYKKIYKEKDKRYNTIIDGKDTEQRADIVINPKHDSVKIATIHYTQYDNTEENPNTLFRGSFQLSGSQLILKGKQDGNNMEAIYKKLPFKDYNWWW